MNGWILAYFAINLLGLGIVMAKHGEVRDDPRYNFWVTLFATVLSIFLLYMGGAFS